MHMSTGVVLLLALALRWLPSKDTPYHLANMWLCGGTMWNAVTAFSRKWSLTEQHSYVQLRTCYRREVATCMLARAISATEQFVIMAWTSATLMVHCVFHTGGLMCKLSVRYIYAMHELLKAVLISTCGHWLHAHDQPCWCGLNPK